MEIKNLAEQLEGLAAIDDRVRRKLYLYVAGRDGAVSRDQAARGARISRPLAAFHLDRLVSAGLLEASFGRRPRRGGPGAGRPPKLYRRAAARFDVTLPPRRYEVAAQILARTLGEMSSEDSMNRLRTAAVDCGKRLAQRLPVGRRQAPPLRRAAQALRLCGFEPRREPGERVVLRNCPFDSRRTDCRELICGMNLALIQGLLAGLDLSSVHAELRPREGLCCVALSGRPIGK